MTPISLGIFASANQSAASTSFESIATATVGSGGVADITFSSIPSTYTHLQVRAIVRGTAGSTQITANTEFYINNDTTSANYTYHRLSGDGSSASAAGGTNMPGAFPGSVTPQNNALSSTYAAYVIDILDYANTNKYKTIRSLSGVDVNGTGTIWFGSMLWLSTSAITSLKFFIEGGANLQQYSHFALYGCKSA